MKKPKLVIATICITLLIATVNHAAESYLFKGWSDGDTNRLLAVSRELKQARLARNPQEANRLAKSVTTTFPATNFSVAELIEVMGQPDAQSDGLITYRFEDGFTGWEWKFSVTNDRVFSIQRRGIE